MAAGVVRTAAIASLTMPSGDMKALRSTTVGTIETVAPVSSSNGTNGPWVGNATVTTQPAAVSERTDSTSMRSEP